MPNEITNSDVTNWVVDDFKRETPGKEVTPSSLLADWDAIYLVAIFADIRRDLGDRGYLMKTLSSRDLSDDKKVGTTVGSLADVIFSDLSPKPVTAAIRANNFSLDQLLPKERHTADSITAAYTQGYKDATTKIVGHLLREIKKSNKPLSVTGKGLTRKASAKTGAATRSGKRPRRKT